MHRIQFYFILTGVNKLDQIIMGVKSVNIKVSGRYVAVQIDFQPGERFPYGCPYGCKRVKVCSTPGNSCGRPKCNQNWHKSRDGDGLTRKVAQQLFGLPRSG